MKLREGARLVRELLFSVQYSEVHLLADLGWVDFDFGSSNFCLVLLGLMGSWQNWLCGWARWGKLPNLSQLNPVRQEMNLPVDPVFINNFHNFSGNAIDQLNLRLCMNSWKEKSSNYLYRLATCIAILPMKRYVSNNKIIGTPP